MHNLNYVQKQVKELAGDEATVIGLVDSGLYIDIDTLDPTKTKLADQAKGIVAYNKAAVDPYCASIFPGEAYKCLLGQYAIGNDTLKAPTVVHAFQYDAYRKTAPSAPLRARALVDRPSGKPPGRSLPSVATDAFSSRAASPTAWDHRPPVFLRHIPCRAVCGSAGAVRLSDQARAGGQAGVERAGRGLPHPDPGGAGANRGARPRGALLGVLPPLQHRRRRIFRGSLGADCPSPAPRSVACCWLASLVRSLYVHGCARRADLRLHTECRPRRQRLRLLTAAPGVLRCWFGSGPGRSGVAVSGLQGRRRVACQGRRRVHDRNPRPYPQAHRRGRGLLWLCLRGRLPRQRRQGRSLSRRTDHVGFSIEVMA